MPRISHHEKHACIIRACQPGRNIPCVFVGDAGWLWCPGWRLATPVLEELFAQAIRWAGPEQVANAFRLGRRAGC